MIITIRHANYLAAGDAINTYSFIIMLTSFFKYT